MNEDKNVFSEIFLTSTTNKFSKVAEMNERKQVLVRAAMLTGDYENQCRANWLNDEQLRQQDIVLAPNELPIIDPITLSPIMRDDVVRLSDGNCYSRDSMQQFASDQGIVQRDQETGAFRHKLPLSGYLFATDDYAALGLQPIAAGSIEEEAARASTAEVRADSYQDSTRRQRAAEQQQRYDLYKSGRAPANAKPHLYYALSAGKERNIAMLQNIIRRLRSSDEKNCALILYATGFIGKNAPPIASPELAKQLRPFLNHVSGSDLLKECFTLESLRDFVSAKDVDRGRRIVASAMINQQAADVLFPASRVAEGAYHGQKRRTTSDEERQVLYAGLLGPYADRFIDRVATGSETRDLLNKNIVPVVMGQYGPIPAQQFLTLLTLLNQYGVSLPINQLPNVWRQRHRDGSPARNSLNWNDEQIARFLRSTLSNALALRLVYGKQGDPLSSMWYYDPKDKTSSDHSIASAFGKYGATSDEFLPLLILAANSQGNAEDAVLNAFRDYASSRSWK
jgi:hypothetical protein